MINDILAPDEGEIRILNGLRPGREAARHIGYLPEERGLYPKMRVLDTLQFFGELRGLSAREARRRGQKWLQRLEIAGWAGNKVQDLSKGMQQKVQFITALIHEPELLILDEPWSGLDPINADVLREIVVEQKQLGRTILFSTHLMEQAEKICDSVCIIARGQKVLEGSLDEIKREAAHDSMVTIGFAGVAAYQIAARGVLADRALVVQARALNDGDGRHDIELAADADADELLRRLVDDGVTVRHFETHAPSLHQIFVDRVSAEGAGERP
jgi:ABC-2 type transport system ATP-binding protein